MISIFKTDAYKLHHINMYPDKTNMVISYLSCRNTKLFDINITPLNGEIYVYGLRYIIAQIEKDWYDNFFNLEWKTIEHEIDEFCKYTNINLDHIKKDYYELWSGHELPLDIYYLDNTTLAPNTPICIIQNWISSPRFFWLVNYIETQLSTEIWSLLTAANISKKLYELSEHYAEQTCENKDHIKWQFHDFSQRGLSSTESAIKSGLGHLSHFKGSDNLPAIVEKYTNPFLRPKKAEIIASAPPATEHSVMCSYTKEKEFYTYEHLLEKYPTGIISIVSDTWDLWNVIENIIKPLKHKIINRKGKVVIRPDSGNPLDIICGTKNQKGLIVLLDDIFGHTVNAKGYKELSPAIGMIYGDSITYRIANSIMDRLQEMGYATNNIVFGVGSYTYQYMTRDLLSTAIKTSVVQVNDKFIETSKSPITDKDKISFAGFPFVDFFLNKTYTDRVYHPNFLPTDSNTYDMWLEYLNDYSISPYMKF